VSYRPFVEQVVTSIVEAPDAVEVEEEVEDGVRTFHITVDKNDVGKVIGKSGRVVAAIRTVVSAIAAKERERAYVKVVTD
jgi:uncharacterized protein